ncbi:MAG: hypothetical protein IPK64_02790 [bacterium]|nr:hypothetical protein [bacterium]
MRVAPRTLNILAAVTWYAGAVSLLRKGVSLLAKEHARDPEGLGLWLALGAGLLLGGLKARFVFSANCRRNLARIAALPDPRLWQFFRPGFFVALAAMITAGVLLSRLARVEPRAICYVAALDLAIGLALLGSSLVFWRQRAFSRKTPA